MQQALEFKNVSFVYRDAVVLEKATISLAADRFLLILGPNGGGKTTFVKLALGLLSPLAGTVRLFGQPPVSSLHLVGYVPQVSSLNVHFPIDVSEVVRLGLYGHDCPAKKTQKKHIEEALHAVSLDHLKNRQFSSLSGGERQRVLIARALISNPSLLILDEPTANVDVHSKMGIYNLLHSLRGSVSIVLISHDPDVASLPISDVAHINRTLYHAPPNEVSPQLISQLIARQMAETPEGKAIEQPFPNTVFQVHPNNLKVLQR
nr:ABC transporter ATP-binding protein [uncultured Cohaesibacter sp.]